LEPNGYGGSRFVLSLPAGPAPATAVDAADSVA
jgi:hypothetical protein